MQSKTNSTQKSYALVRQERFIDEQRTELYIKYRSGVAQAKNVHGAKSTLLKQALLGFARGAA